MKTPSTPPGEVHHGMTLLELTVVILVLFTLIAVLFIGARAYKNEADRSACIMNIRNVQQAVRSDQNLRAKAPNESGLQEAHIYNESGSLYMVTPSCPAEGVYTFTEGVYPAPGELVLSCDLASVSEHVPLGGHNW